MSHLILVRHGNTFEKGETPVYVGSQTDLSLTAKGHEQAQTVSLYLKNQGIQPKTIFSGTLQRQRETASHIAKESDVQIVSALDEIDYGPWEGLSTEQIQERWKPEYDAWCHSAAWPSNIFPKDEHFYQSRVKDWLENISQTSDCKDVTIGVTSNGLIRYVYSLLDSTWSEKVKERSIEDLKVKTGHICHLELSRQGSKILKWNVNPKV